MVILKYSTDARATNTYKKIQKNEGLQYWCWSLVRSRQAEWWRARMTSQAGLARVPGVSLYYSMSIQYVCIYVCVAITYSKGKDQPGKAANPVRGRSAEQGELIFPCPRSRLRIWSRETGSTVPSRVSLLISILNYTIQYYTILRLNLVR